MDQPKSVQVSKRRGEVTVLVEPRHAWEVQEKPRRKMTTRRPVDQSMSVHQLLVVTLMVLLFVGTIGLSWAGIRTDDVMKGFLGLLLFIYVLLIPFVRSDHSRSSKSQSKTLLVTREEQRLVIDETVTRSESNQSTGPSWHREAIQSFRVRKRSEGSFDILATADNELVTLFKDLDEEEVKAVSTHLEAHLAPKYFAVPETVRIIQGEQPGYRETSERTVEVQPRGERAAQRVRIGGHHAVEAITIGDGIRVVAQMEGGEVTLFEELDEDEARAVVAALAAED